MKKKILIGALLLVSLMAGTFVFESFTNQNDVLGNVAPGVHAKTDRGGCTGDGDSCIEVPR